MDTPTIHLLVGHDRNRELLASQLAGRYDVTTPAPGGDASLDPDGFDLCVVDAAAFERYRDAIERARADADPVFLPFLLLERGGRSQPLPEPVWEVVDEVVAVPVRPATLARRLDNLLRRRDLSRRLERRRRRSAERFRALFESVPDPVFVVSPDGEIETVNAAFTRTFGVDRASVEGRSVTEVGLSPPEAVVDLLGLGPEGLASRADSETGAEDVLELAVPDGDARFLELRVDVVTDGDEVTERVGVLRDVTERRARREVLETQNERLQQFAGTIAHDLRNPLTVAEGYAERALQSGDETHLESVRDAHERMEELIDELLRLARQGRVVLAPAPVSLEAVAREAWRNVETGSLALAVEGDESVMADRNRLRELLENLYRNAFEHASGATAVRVAPLDGEAGFFVADDGGGFRTANRDLLFESGYTTAEDGTGFGLAIVRQIASGHGWSVRALDGDDTADGGVRFEVADCEFAEGAATDAPGGARPSGPPGSS